MSVNALEGWGGHVVQDKEWGTVKHKIYHIFIR